MTSAPRRSLKGTSRSQQEGADPSTVYAPLPPEPSLLVAQTSEVHFRRLLDNLLEGCQIVDFDWRYTYVNRAFAAQAGLPAEELVGRHLTDVLPGIAGAPLIELLQRCMNERVSAHLEEELTLPHGSVGWYDLSIQPVSEGLLILSADASERRQIEIQTRESQELFRRSFHFSPTATALRRLSDGRFVQANQSFLKLTGYALDEVLGRTPAEVGITSDPKSRAVPTAAPTDSGQLPGFEVQILTKTGQQRRGIASVGILSSGNEQFALYALLDITERTEAQKLQQALFDIAEAPEEVAALDDLYPKIHEIISRVMPAENFYIALYDPDTDKLIFPYFVDQSDRVEVTGISPERGLTAYVLRTGKSVLCTQSVHDELERLGEIKLLGTPSAIWLGVPLVVDSVVIGVMVVQDYADGDAYSQHDQRVLEYVSSQVAKAIERKRAADEVSRTTEELQALIQACPAGIITYDPEGRVKSWNPAAARITGYTEAEVLGRRAAHLLPAELPESDAIRRRALMGEAIVGMEVDRHRKDGSPIFLTLSTAPTKNSQGEINGYMAILEDITDRRKAREALQAAEQKYRTLAEQLPVAIYTDYGDDTGTKEYLSPQLERITGYRAEEWVGNPDFWPRTIHPEDRERVLAENVRTNETGEPFVAEYRLVKPDGASVWVREEAIRTSDGEAGTQKWQGVIADISQRKQAELESHALLEIMRGLAASPDLGESLRLIHRWIGEVIYAENFSVILYNGESGLFEEIYLVDKFDPPAPPSRLEKSLSAYVFRTREPILLAGSQFETLAASGEVELIGADSSSWLGAPLKAGGKTIGVMSVQDYENRDRYSEHDKEFLASIATQVAMAIQRKQAESAVRVSEARFRTLFQQAPLGIALKDVRGRDVETNPAMQSMCGFSGEELRQMNFTEFTHPEDIESDLQQFQALVAGSQDQYSLEKRYVRRDGQVIWGRLHASRVPAEAGEAPLFIVMVEDITQRKQAEVAAQRHLAELEALYQNGLALGKLLDPAEIGARLIRTLEDYLAWQHVVIHLARPDTDELDVIAWSGPSLDSADASSPRELPDRRVGRGEAGLSGSVVQSGTSIIAANLHDFPGCVETSPGMSSGIYVPLKTGNDIIGCISAESEGINAFGPDDERLLGTLANQAVIAFDNARLYRGIERQNSILLALQTATVPMLGRGELSEVLQTIIAQASQLLGVENGYIYLVDAETGNLEVAVGTGVFAGSVGTKLERGEGLAGKVLERVEPVQVEDYQTWPGKSRNFDDIEFHAVLGVPLVSGSSVHGVLGLAHTDPGRPFTDDDVELLGRFAQLAALAFENARLYDAVQMELQQRYRTEAALRESEAKYRHLFEHILNGFAYCQMLYSEAGPEDFVYLDVNDAFTKLTGLQDVVGRTATQLIPGIREQTPEIFEIYARVASTGIPERFELDFTPLGMWLDVAVYSPQEGYFVALFDNISERKRSEALLHERLSLMEYSASHSLPELLTRTLDDLGALTHSGAGFFYLVDEESQTLSLEACSGSGTGEAQKLGHTEIPCAVEQSGLWAEALRERQPLIINDWDAATSARGLLEAPPPLSRLMVIPVQRSERVEALMCVAEKPVGYGPGDLEIATRFADYAWDIAEKKQMEVNLAEERNLLAQRVEQRTSQLAFVNAELARANKLKDEFLATMSHELRTPLNAILSLSESLEEGVYGELSPMQSSTIRTVAESGQHLLELINDILDVSKIEAGKLNLQIQAVDIDQVCQASIRLLRQQAMAKRQKLTFSRDPAVKAVLADERRLKQMLVNLLSNAVKFTPEDGQVGVEVTSDGDGETVRFTVWDSGPGIATDQLPNLFQPFVQLDSSLSRHYAGTGLGLALVRRLAELHGGGAGVESELGKGSRFYVALPAAIQGGCGSDDVETGQAMNGTEAYDAHGICLLVCDDNPVNLAAVSDYLAAVGFRVVTAIDGLQALQRLDEARPAVILMDIQMPEMDGLEATRRIRAIPEYGSVPIIAITALAMPGDRERCLEAGANDFMTKPLSQRALMAKILDLLQVVT